MDKRQEKDFDAVFLCAMLSNSYFTVILLRLARAWCMLRQSRIAPWAV